MDAATLGRAMFNSLPPARYAQLLPHCQQAMRQAKCTNQNRAAMWLAQLGHESVGLKYTEEIASGAQYEGRPDLGNTQPGDGRRFKGRSFIQITGRHNYTQLSAWAHSKGYVPTRSYFVDNPPQLAADRYAFLGAVWYWLVARPNLNRLADARDLNGATRAINGGLNGLPDRQQRYARCLSLGNTILPEADVNEKQVEQMIQNALRAYHMGGRYGRWDPRKFPNIIKGKNDGVADRLMRLEKKIK